MRGQPNLQREAAGTMPDFPVYGPATSQGVYNRYPETISRYSRNDQPIPLDLPPSAYGAFCDPEIRYINEQCIEQFPFMSNSGQYQYGTSYDLPIGAQCNSWQQQRRPYPFFEWGLMGQYQLQYPDTQYAETKSAFGIDKVYGPSFGEWVTGPWIQAITQEVYHQYNAPLPTPWGR